MSAAIFLLNLFREPFDNRLLHATTSEMSAWLKGLPPWGGKAVKFTKYVPYAGIPVTLLFLEEAYREDNEADQLRYAISLAFDVVGLFVPIVSIGGIIWDYSWDMVKGYTNILKNPVKAVVYYQKHPVEGILTAKSPWLGFSFGNFEG